MDRVFTLAGRVGQLRARGATVAGDVAEAVLSGDLDLSTTEVSQLTIAFSDPELRLLATRLFDAPRAVGKPGSSLDYGGLAFEVAAVDIAPAAGGFTLGVTARSHGAQKLRALRGAIVRRNLSPTGFAALEAKAAGLGFVGEPTTVRRTVARTKDESSWEAVQRLAKEIGFIAFEAGNVLHFARPTWLAQRQPQVDLVWRGSNTGDEIVSPPTCRRTGDEPGSGQAATVEIAVAAQLGDRVRPGMALDLGGIPTFTGRYLITNVKIPLDDTSPVTLSAATAVNPEPEPPGAATGSSGSSGSTAAGKPPSAGTYGGTKFNASQLAIATTIDRTGRRLGATSRDIVMAIMCAMQESNLRTGAAVRGKDHDSVGAFQQRPSQGWGTVAQCEDNVYAATKFYKALFKVSGRATRDKTLVIQAVQRSAYPYAYRKWEPEATAIWRVLEKSISSGGGSNSGTTGGSKSASLFVQLCLSQAGDPYVFGAEAKLSDTDPDRFDCSELVEWAAFRAGVKFVDGAANQMATCRQKGTLMTVSKAYQTRGALLFLIGVHEFNHVAVSLGDGKRTIEAAGRSYGNKVRIGAVQRSFHWTHAGLIPGMRY